MVIISAQACAHRYVRARQWETERLGIGMCITMTNTLDENMFLEPCEGLDVDKKHEDYGMCQGGTSVDVDKV